MTRRAKLKGKMATLVMFVSVWPDHSGYGDFERTGGKDVESAIAIMDKMLQETKK